MQNGNHDDNSIRDSGVSINNQIRVPTKTIFDYELYNYYNKFLENSSVVFGGKGKQYFYMDLATQKVRVFILNSIDIPYDVDNEGKLKYTGQWTFGYRNEQLNFVANSLKFNDKNDKSEWTSIFITHVGVPIDGDGVAVKNDDILRNIINAYKNGTSYIASGGDIDFQYNINVSYNFNGKCVGIVSGHRHIDTSNTVNNILNIITTLAKYTERTTDENINETAFDIFTIDTNERKIYCTRFGSGNDREFNY